MYVCMNVILEREKEILRPVSCVTWAKKAAISRLESSTEPILPNSLNELRASRKADRVKKFFPAQLASASSRIPLKNSGVTISATETSLVGGEA